MDMVRWLLAHGANPNAESHHGLTPFLKAVQVSSLATVRLLHEAGASLGIAVPFVCAAPAAQDGETEADGAARRLQVLRYLLDNGADPEAPMWFVLFSSSTPSIQSPTGCLMSIWNHDVAFCGMVPGKELYLSSRDSKRSSNDLMGVKLHRKFQVANVVHRAHNRYGRGNDFDYGTGLNRAIVKRAESLAEELLRRGARTDSKTMNIASRGETALELAVKYTPRLVPLVAERRREEELTSGGVAP